MTSMPWFRMYSEFIFDEKIEFLAFEDQRHFVFVLCMKNLGLIDKDYPQHGMLDRVVAKRLGLYGEAFENAKTRLVESGLIDGRWQPVAWEKRQFRSDADPTATDRKRRQRERQKHVHGDVTRDTSVTSRTGHGDVTHVDVDTDTDTEEACAATATPPAPLDEQKKKAPAVSFDTFVKRRKAAGEKLIAEDDPIFDWAESAGIPDDWLRLAWAEFSARYRGNAKRYADWPATFRNAVRGNWFKLWRIADGGRFVLTTEGEMGRRAAEAKPRQPVAVTA